MYAVIMAGGSGTRFWPRSRQQRPKQLLNIVGSRSMLQQTVARISPLLPLDHILVVAGITHGEEVQRQLEQLPPENIILEPVGRNTAPCIGLAAMIVHQRDPGAVMMVLPADHLIDDQEAFVAALQAAMEMARRQDALITLGIKPAAPETGYGYIEAGEQVGNVRQHPFYRVQTFHEKPDRQLAERYVAQGNFYWNSGMFVWRAEVILQAIERHLPDLYSSLATLRRELESGNLAKGLAQVYPGLQSISIDYGVMEKADNVLMVPVDFGWNDLGTWAAMAQIWPRDEQHNAILGEVVPMESTGNIVYSPNRLCLLLGVDDLIVVDTDDALLVCPVSRAQDVGKALDLLARRGLNKYL